MKYSALLSSIMTAIVKGDTGIAPQLLRDKEDFPPEAQLGVYTEGYRLRLQGALESTYPALFYCLGSEAFGALANGFIEAQPSRMFNLDKYTIGFGLYVAGAIPHAFACDLAMLECAIHDVYQREETPAIAPDWAAGQSPEALSTTPFLLRTASTLLAFAWPVDDYLTAFREERKPEQPAPEKSWLVVLRHRHQVKRLKLEEAEYALLSLFAEGLPLASSLDDPRMAPFIGHENFGASLQGWFARWAQEGVLRQPS